MPTHKKTTPLQNFCTNISKLLLSHESCREKQLSPLSPNFCYFLKVWNVRRCKLWRFRISDSLDCYARARTRQQAALVHNQNCYCNTCTKHPIWYLLTTRNETKKMCLGVVVFLVARSVRPKFLGDYKNMLHCSYYLKAMLVHYRAITTGRSFQKKLSASHKSNNTYC